MNEPIFANENGFESLGARLLNKRAILAFGEINEKTSFQIISALLYLAGQDSNAPITLYINSVGGNETDALAIYDVMRNLSCPIHTVCVGKAHGMASLLLVGGAKGERAAYANSEIMLTQVERDRTFGQASDIELETNHLLDVKARVNALFATLCDKDIAQINKDMERKHWLFAEQALAYGLIDKILK